MKLKHEHIKVTYTCFPGSKLQTISVTHRHHVVKLSTMTITGLIMVPKNAKHTGSIINVVELNISIGDKNIAKIIKCNVLVTGTPEELKEMIDSTFRSNL